MLILVSPATHLESIQAVVLTAKQQGKQLRLVTMRQAQQMATVLPAAVASLKIASTAPH